MMFRRSRRRRRPTLPTKRSENLILGPHAPYVTWCYVQEALERMYGPVTIRGNAQNN